MRYKSEGLQADDDQHSRGVCGSQDICTKSMLLDNIIQQTLKSDDRLSPGRGGVGRTVVLLEVFVDQHTAGDLKGTECNARVNLQKCGTGCQARECMEAYHNQLAEQHPKECNSFKVAGYEWKIMTRCSDHQSIETAGAKSL